MKRSLRVWQIGGFLFTGILGSLLHFLYDWTNQSIIIAPFSATNESTWEHIKLLFVPMFIFSLIEYKFLGKDYENFWCVKLIGITVGMLTIPLLFYTYTGTLGVTADWFNIVIFFIAAAAGYYPETKLLKNEFTCNFKIPSFIILCVIALAFIVLTFVQPKIPLFQDPTNGIYGI